jgi:hypothetical protein
MVKVRPSRVVKPGLIPWRCFVAEAVDFVFQ